MKSNLWLFCLLLFFRVALPALSLEKEKRGLLDYGSVILSPQALNDIDKTLSQLETNSTRQRELSTSLTGELRQAELSLTTLRTLYNEQSALTMSLRNWTNQMGERLSESDQSLVWAMEDAELLESELAQERTKSARLDRSARVWRTVAIVLGAAAIGGVIAAVVW
jgi:chromosome segregation ATPase